MLKKFSIILGALFLSHAGSAFAAQLNYGKYFGTLQMNGRSEAVAVSLDAFIVQINEPTVYPALNVILRINLGGYQSAEYVAYNFYDPTFNFEKGILQLNDPKNELTAILQVTNTATQTILEGPVNDRMTNAKGKLRVVMNLDASLMGQEKEPSLPLLSMLRGEYIGKCGSDSGNLQIETGRLLGANSPGNALSGYSITGRLGFPNASLCSPDKNNKFCSQSPFSTGAYSPFTGRLTMHGPLGDIDCNKRGDALECNFFLYNRRGTCKLEKSASASSPPNQALPSIFLKVPPSQKAPLPSPQPPGNEELLAALNGDFYGFLHYENRDAYQLMEMSVVATTSTENPHIQNQVMIEPTVLLRLGSSWDSLPALSAAYPQRIFFMNPGFALESDENDYFIVINNWRMGYISGVLYSRSFGRVGTFEILKGERPMVPPEMSVIPNPAGEYRGPTDSPQNLKNIWSLSIEVPNQIPSLGQSGIPLLARFGGPGIMNTFDAALVDLNSGAMSLLIKNGKGDRLVTGEVLPNNSLRLLWPTGPALGAPMAHYQPFIYLPLTGN
jgi:hypothetical protein